MSDQQRDHIAVSPLSPQRIEGAPLPGALRELADDSRQVVPGGAFVAVSKGGVADGHAFIGDAIAAGARVVFCEHVPGEVAGAEGVSFVALDSTRQRLPAIAELVYGRPADALALVGVTGTNGKTTSTFLLESLGGLLGLKVGVIGTISHRFPGYHEAAVNTTPDVVKTVQLLRKMADAGCDWVAMEVSSHGLDIGRVDNLAFDVGVWTSFSQDHLDYHQTMDAYLAAKRRFFDTLLPASVAAGKTPWAVVNHDDGAVRALFADGKLAQGFGGRQLWFGIENPGEEGFTPSPAFVARGLEAVAEGWRGHLVAEGRSLPLALPLYGRFNVHNALGAAAAAHVLGASLDAVAAALPNIAQVPGRMQRLGGGMRPLVFVDYAHTPDALARALEAVRENGFERVHVVFGAGGDRDPGKRPLMGAAAASLADHVVVTNDNPRTEAPQAIADAILDGVPADAASRVSVELDRARAIALAVAGARAGEAVLVAGKGHEDYQIIGTTRHAMDDRELVRRALDAWQPPDEDGGR